MCTSSMQHGFPTAEVVIRVMRGAMLVVVMLVATSTSTRLGAQSSPKPVDPPRQAAAVATRAAAAQLAGLELTPEQKARIEAITVKYADATRAAMNGIATDRADGIRKVLALRERMLPEFRAVLTSAQREIFDRNMADMKSLMLARP